MTTDPLPGFLKQEKTLVATIGFPPGSDPTRTEPRSGHTVIDLDELDLESLPAGEHSRLAIVARTMTDLHRAVAAAGLLRPVRRCLVSITQVAAVNRPTQVRLPAFWTAQSLRDMRVRSEDQRWSCEFTTHQPLEPADFVRAVIASTVQTPRPVSPRVALHGPGSGHWSPGAAAGPRPATALEGQPATPYYDILLHTAPTTGLSDDERIRSIEVRDPRPARKGIFGGGRDAVHDTADPGLIPPVDEHTVNRMGFDNHAKELDAALAYQDGTWQVQYDNGRKLRLDPSGAVTDFDVERLRDLRALRVRWDGHPGSAAGLRTVAGLACAGLPLVDGGTAPVWAGSLDKDLLDRIGVYDPDDLGDPLRREAHCVALSRSALREHSTAAHARRLRQAVGLPPRELPTVSVVLCTMRPDFIASAMRQIVAQRHPNIEVVLVLHGLDQDDPSVKQAVAECPLPITVIEVDGGEIFGAALNRGAAAASGDYLTKFDDDDWYSPNHVVDLLDAARYSGAVLVGCAAELIYLEEFDLTIQRFGGRSERRSQHVAGGTILVDRSVFRDVGGYRHLRTAEDRELLAAVTESGGTVYRMHGTGYVLARRAGGHTWNRPSAEFLQGAERQLRGVNLGDHVSNDNLEAAL